MSTLPATSPSNDSTSHQAAPPLDQRILSWIRPLGSLKLAVVSFAVAIILILIATLAQVNRDIWEVLEVYFKNWWTWVDVMVFFPRSWFPQLDPGSATRMFVTATMGGGLLAGFLTWFNGDCVRRARPIALAIMAVSIVLSLSALRLGGFWFPGGVLVGSVMAINLLFAHATRYRVQARGQKLTWGLVVTGLGIAVTAAVIISGHNASGFQGEPPFAWRTLWLGVKVGLTIAAAGLLIFSLFGKTEQPFVRPISGGSGLVFAALVTWLWATGNATYLGDSGMRVLWQLILAMIAATVLLVGCIMLFRQRAGVIVLHAGVGLLMFGQWFVTLYDAEEQMTMVEGQTINYGQDIRSVELAVILPASPDSSGQDSSGQDSSDQDSSGQDEVYAIPLTLNGYPTRFLTDKRVVDDRLPFDIEIVDYARSSTVEMNRSGEPIADAGLNQEFQMVPARAAAGAMSSGVDIGSGYFRIVDKQTKEPLGTFLLSQEVLEMRDGRQRKFDLESVTVNDQPIDVQLRFVRNYKDYSMQLIDVRKDDYLGTTIPRNYSSRVRMKDKSRNVDRELTIWMNNPRRYAGETFYQSGWQQDSFGNEYTTLQVVRNYGWMIPYVACMIGIVGMGYHFSLILLRFLSRQVRAEDAGSDATSDNAAPSGDRSKFSLPAPWNRLVIPLAVAAAFALLVGRLGTPPPTASGELDLFNFGQLPLVYQGRVKPFDTLARNSLRVISDIESFKGVLPANELSAAWPTIEKELKDEYPAIQNDDLTKFKSGDVRGLIQYVVKETNGDEYSVTQAVEKKLMKRQPAVRWLLDVITGSDPARRHKVIRIYHPEVLDLLELKRRKYYRYSLEEIAPKMDAFQEQVQQADAVRRRDVEQVSLYQKKILETDRRIRMILLLHRAFSPPELPELPSTDEFQSDRTAAMRKLDTFREAMIQQDRAIRSFQPPLSVAPIQSEDENTEWQAYAAAWPRQLLTVRVLGGEAQPSFKALNDIMLSYLDHDVSRFNDSVRSYHRLLAQNPPKDLVAKPSMTTSLINKRFGNFYRFESYFNHFAPFFYCSFLYLLAFVLLCFGWLKWRRAFNQAAFWLIVFTFVIHTLALVARMYISGRPPVTNLYSSAVFIGWGVVLLALIIELIFRSGLASLAAAASGFITLLIAHKLAGDGDTFEVLQAVLDTQFWLATHVVCITLGYATTFLAGLLGVLYIVRGVATPSLDRKTSSELARMIYGTLCFAIFFSFFGTVLGGLWADDSWGRFWGWDPKENGALIIVLWNALILHARWDKMVRDRGLAVLAVMGNVVTAWSWFGVNELGVGLHSYGFTEGRLLTLALTVLAHLILVVVGWLPLSLWWSFRRDKNDLNQGTT